VDSLPSNPLSAIGAPSIEVFIPTAGKDFDVLQACVSALEVFCQNPISKITISSPSPLLVAINSRYPVVYVSDGDVLTEILVDALEKSKADDRNIVNPGWVRQQVLKIKYALDSSCEEGVLVIDSDTMLSNPRTFVDSNDVQILIVGY